MVILSHPTGNAFSKEAAYNLAEAQHLAEFHTAFASFPGSILDRLGAFAALSDIRRRRLDPVLRNKTRLYPWWEIGRQTAAKIGFHRLTRHEYGMFSVDAIYRNHDKKVASRLKQKYEGVHAVYAYEDGAEFSFREAKKNGLRCFYDLPIGYWRSARRLLGAEKEVRPEWAITLKGFLDSTAKLQRKDEELKLADKIFVASQFTANTLTEFPGALAPVKIIPYGFPPVVKNRIYSTPYNGRPLKLLFVGGLSQRKGIAEMFDAVENLKNYVELTIVGQKASEDCPALNAALARHRWIPSLPHGEVLKLMQAHDVLLFPSLFEGFGLVITEAMSQGTPVITTDRTAGPDLMSHNYDGWLTEAGSSIALIAAIEQLILKPEVVSKVGKAAMETARLRPWEQYGRELTEAIIQP